MGEVTTTRISHATRGRASDGPREEKGTVGVGARATPAGGREGTRRQRREQENEAERPGEKPVVRVEAPSAAWYKPTSRKFAHSSKYLCPILLSQHALPRRLHQLAASDWSTHNITQASCLEGCLAAPPIPFPTPFLHCVGQFPTSSSGRGSQPVRVSSRIVREHSSRASWQACSSMTRRFGSLVRSYTQAKQDGV